MKNILASLFFFASLATAAPVHYTYDAAGRLTGIDYGAGGSIAYAYDAAGNIISRVVQPGNQSPSIIQSAHLTADRTRIELTGTNLAPAQGGEVAVTVNGQEARVLSSCNASVKDSHCRADRVVIEVPTTLPSQIEIHLKNGAHQEATWKH